MMAAVFLLAASGYFATTPVARKLQLGNRWQLAKEHQSHYEERQSFFADQWSLEAAFDNAPSIVVPRETIEKARPRPLPKPLGHDVGAQKEPSTQSAFTDWREQQERQDFFGEASAHYQERVQRAVNRLAHPDVPLKIVFEGIAVPAVIPGNATTDALFKEATRLHSLDPKQKLRFVIKGKKPVLYMGVPISDTPLAGTRNLEVLVMPALAGAVRRKGADWWANAGTGSGHRRTATARANDDIRTQEMIRSKLNKMAHVPTKKDMSLMQREVNKLALEAERQRKANAKRVQALLQNEVNRLAGPAAKAAGVPAVGSSKFKANAAARMAKRAPKQKATFPPLQLGPKAASKDAPKPASKAILNAALNQPKAKRVPSVQVGSSWADM